MDNVSLKILLDGLEVDFKKKIVEKMKTKKHFKIKDTEVNYVLLPLDDYIFLCDTYEDWINT